MNMQPQHLDDWEELLTLRYPPGGNGKPKEAFRDYRAEARPSVKEFYRLNHRHQTLEFVLAKKAEFLPLARRRMGVWEAMEFLNTLVDDSDPDTDLSQIEHLMQTAEAIRRDGHPRWFILVGLLHDLGKILCLFGEPQWAVVGDTFPVGCRFSEKIVFSELFDENPDTANPAYQTECGIYQPACGLDRVHLSWGHDEYLYQVTMPYLPEPAQYMIRYHSFYAGHREGEYAHLTGTARCSIGSARSTRTTSTAKTRPGRTSRHFGRSMNSSLRSSFRPSWPGEGI